MKLISWCPAVASTSLSICGTANGSFGHDLFRSVKSMQTLHLSFFFLMTTMLASHSGYWTSLMNPVFYRFLTSSLMISSLSGANFLLLCLMGWCKGSTWSLCTITSGSIPGISSWDQAKQSELDRRKSISLHLKPSACPKHIFKFCAGSPSVNGTSSILRPPALQHVKP